MPGKLVFNKDKVVLGTAGLAGIWGDVDKRESVDAILFALESGITHFDSAPAYSDAESILGKALSQWHGADPFISTKVGKLKSDSPDSVAYDYSSDAMEKSVYESLKTLGVEKIDLLFLHDPPGMGEHEILSALEFMNKIKEKGIVKNIGIGGNYGSQFSSYVGEACFDYFMGFNRYNIINQAAIADEFITLDKAKISKWQASPLYMGLLGSRFHTYQDMQPSWISDEDLLRAKKLNHFCIEKGIKMPMIALQFLMNATCIDKIVIGASNMNELESTFSYLSNQVFNCTALIDEFNAIE